MPVAELFQDPFQCAEPSLVKAYSALQNLTSMVLAGLTGMARYTSSFYFPYLAATHYFQQVEAKRLFDEPPLESLASYVGLLENNIDLISRSLHGSASLLQAYLGIAADGFNNALQQHLRDGNPDLLMQFFVRQARLLDLTANTYPRAINAIAAEYGFHFESGKHALVDETDRFYLYQVAPSLPGRPTKKDAKPILIIPPYVLGANILGFLPGEQRSYAHCFANQGYPTYIRILKTIEDTPALQVMRGEDDALDTMRFCRSIFRAHGKPVTLNGYCQGGFNALCTLLSGKLDDLVDAFITCVSPMDGTRSKGLARFLGRLPKRFNNLAYGTKTLANGNQVADGELMGWVYKLKSIEQEIPAAAFLRDLMMFARQKDADQQISKTAAALNYWLQHERNDLPLEITRLSFQSYNTPIDAEGTLPVRFFGGKLNLKRLSEKKIPWLICYGIHDDLVEKETALAPLDYIEAEVAAFPKGHVAIATSWSLPESACALHTRFGDENYRGPVRFHMDMDMALEKAIPRQAKKTAPKAAMARRPDESAAPSASTAKKATTAAPAGRGKVGPAAKSSAQSTATKNAKPKPARPLTGRRSGPRGTPSPGPTQKTKS